MEAMFEWEDEEEDKEDKVGQKTAESAFKDVG